MSWKKQYQRGRELGFGTVVAFLGSLPGWIMVVILMVDVLLLLSLYH
jgi:hypothetical protein